MKEFINKNKKELLVLGLVVLIGAIFRFYKIDQYMTFLGDEGRDAIIVRRFLVYGDIFLIGPGTSIGNMYLGPLYYYMMAPALLLANFSPVGPAIGVALLSLVTIVLIWWVGREWFNSKAGLIAAFLYAISPTVIIYSRSSWNPNIMPFFALLAIYSAWKVLKTDNHKWIALVGVSFAACLQSHYLGLLLGPTLGLVLAFAFFATNKKKSFIVWSFVSLVLFALLMSPLVIFDARHGWRNFDALKTFFTVRQTTVSIKPWNAIPALWPITEKITTRLVSGRNILFGQWTALFVVLGTFFVFTTGVKKLTLNNKFAFAVLIAWLAIAFLGMGLYKQEIYDHYYGFFFPAPFLLVGGVSAFIIKQAKIRGTWIVLTCLIFLTYFNFLDNPLRFDPNRQMQRSIEVADKIIEESNGEKFNLAVVAERNYEDAYEYFLQRENAKVVDIDPQNTKDTITSQLFVVCELPREKCQPTNSPKAEVANFGWSKVEADWEQSGVIIYKLVHAR